MISEVSEAEVPLLNYSELPVWAENPQQSQCKWNITQRICHMFWNKIIFFMAHTLGWRDYNFARKIEVSLQMTRGSRAAMTHHHCRSIKELSRRTKYAVFCIVEMKSDKWLSSNSCMSYAHPRPHEYIHQI